MVKVVFLHGFLGLGSDWKRVIQKTQMLLNKEEVSFCCPDLLSDDKYLAPFREFPFVFNRQVSLEEYPTILVGYSMGGRLALKIAEEKFSGVHSLLLFSSHPGLLSEYEKIKREDSDAEWANLFLSTPWAETLLRWQGQGVLQQTKRLGRKENDYSREALSFALKEWSVANQDIAFDHLSSLSMKYFYGERDLKYKKLKDQYPAFVQKMEIKNSGHRILFDDPDAVAQILAQEIQLLV